MSDTLRRYKASEICLHEANGQSIRMNALFYLAADVAGVVGEKEFWKKDAADKQDNIYAALNRTVLAIAKEHRLDIEADKYPCGTVKRLIAILLEKHEAALAAKEARIVELEKRCQELYARTPAGIAEAVEGAHE